MEVVPHRWPPTIRKPGNIRAGYVNWPIVTDTEWVARLTDGGIDTELSMCLLPFLRSVCGRPALACRSALRGGRGRAQRERHSRAWLTATGR